MRTIKSIGLLLIAGLAITACSNDENETIPQSQTEKAWHASAIVGKEQSTRTLTLAENAINVGWSTSEKVFVIKNDVNAGFMSPTTNTSGTATTLTGDLDGAVDFSIGDEATLRFPHPTVDYTWQKGSLADIAENFDYAEGTATVETVNGEGKALTFSGVTLKSLQAIVKFTFSHAVSSVTIASANVYEGVGVNITPASPTTTIYAALPVSTEGTETTFSFKAVVNDVPYSGTKTVSGGLVNGQFYTANVMLQEVSAPSDARYVDLGLPSGTLWANMNVGAESEIAYGNIYSWGEVTGYFEGKTYFGWSSYKWAKGTTDANPMLTKYCGDASLGYNDFTDNVTALEPFDDAAYMNWGSDWRMPTWEQAKELVENCTYQQQLNYQGTGINGTVLTGPNGNTMFLPYSGSIVGTAANSHGSFGNTFRCFVRDYRPTIVNIGTLTYDTSSHHAVFQDRRCWGFGVRPVYVGNAGN